MPIYSSISDKNNRSFTRRHIRTFIRKFERNPPTKSSVLWLTVKQKSKTHILLLIRFSVRLTCLEINQPFSTDICAQHVRLMPQMLSVSVQIKGKGKVHPRTCHEGPEGQ